jgi:regulator of replication initiation timing
VEYEKLFDRVAENQEAHKNTNVEQFIMEKWKADSEKLMTVTVIKNEGICVCHEDFF